MKTVGGSLNLIAEAFTQKDQGEEDTQTGELEERTVRKVTEPLKMGEPSLGLSGQGRKDGQASPLQGITVKKGTEPLNLRKESLDA